jgi:hypothetical protein
MCLYKDKKHHPFNRPLVAGEDIVCYKVLTQALPGSPNVFCTPFQLEPIRIPVHLNYQIPFIAQDDNKFCSFWRHKLGFSRIVESGFIHTFRENYFIPLHRYESLFKCIIPKGTEYFIGIDNDYASERIIFLEKIDAN